MTTAETQHSVDRGRSFTERIFEFKVELFAPIHEEEKMS